MIEFSAEVEYQQAIAFRMGSAIADTTSTPRAAAAQLAVARFELTGGNDPLDGEFDYLLARTEADTRRLQTHGKLLGLMAQTATHAVLYREETASGRPPEQDTAHVLQGIINGAFSKGTTRRTMRDEVRTGITSEQAAYKGTDDYLSGFGFVAELDKVLRAAHLVTPLTFAGRTKRHAQSFYNDAFRSHPIRPR